MSLQSVMQAGPAKANELFAKLSDTSDGAIKTRERLFRELKAELELHTMLEEQHLFPILRRHAETKELVADAVKDNKELRTKLAELEALPKNDDAFPERLKEMQKFFRQHARDEKRELLPAVQRALSDEQVQGVTEKLEAGAANAEQARQDDLEQRRVKARQEREQAEQWAQAERDEQAAAEQVRQDEAAQKRTSARLERQAAELRAEQEAAARRAQEEAQHLAREATETMARAASEVPENVLHIAKTATASFQRLGAEWQDVTQTCMEAARSMVPDLRATASLPVKATGAMLEVRSAWLEWLSETTRAGTRLSQELVLRAAEHQQRFATDAVRGWMQRNTRMMEIAARVAQEGFVPFAQRTAGSSERQETRAPGSSLPN